MKLASIATAAAIVIGAPMLIAPEEAFARDVQPYAGLTPCKSNAAFKKREKNELKTLEKRLKKVSLPDVETRFAIQSTFSESVLVLSMYPRTDCRGT